MDEKEWMDDVVYQRLELLLNSFYRSKKNEKAVEDAVFTQAEDVMKRLTEDEWAAMDQLLDQIGERNSRETAYLYVCGLKDGIRAMKFISSL